MIPAIPTSQLSDLVLTMARSGLALMLYGAPGIGKTSLLQNMGHHPDLLAWASRKAGRPVDELPVVTLSAPELNVEDLLGVPTVEELVRRLPDGGSKAFQVTRWALPALFDPTRPFILFIDEPNRCEPAVRNALFQFITGRTTTSGFELPQGSVVVMAGNRLEDKAGVRTLDTAFNNRCGHFELQVDTEAWLDWAQSQPGFSPLVRAFIGRHPNFLIRFNPASPHPQQATPRTWAALGLALDQAPDSLRESLALGLLGPEVGQLFKAFQKHADAMPTLNLVLSHAHGLPVPDSKDLDKAWILATALSDFLILRVGDGLDTKVTDAVVGAAVGTVICRLVQAGFEEVITFALRRAWRVIQEEASRQLKPPRSLRFFGAVKVLATDPAFGSFAEALNELGAA
jgi:hypothetical protein